jgi:hypothetical protein
MSGPGESADHSCVRTTRIIVWQNDGLSVKFAFFTRIQLTQLF